MSLPKYSFELLAAGEMLPPLQHFVPSAAVWRRPVSLGACRNKHFSLVPNSKRRELFHYGLVCKRKLLTARELPCHNGMRNGRGEESKGSCIPLRKHYYGSSQAVSTAERLVLQIHSHHTEHQLLSTDDSQAMLGTPPAAEEQDWSGLSHRSINRV